MLRVEHLVKSWGARRAVDDLTIQLERGEIYALVGPNGSGKTTTMSMIVGLVKPDSGTISLGTDGRARVGFAAQELGIYRDLTPRENLRFFARTHGSKRRAAAEIAGWLLELFGFGERSDLPASSLSGGWQRRLHVAIALVQRAPLVILDEPTAGLDVEARMDLWAIIRELRAEGTSFLVSTHDLHEAERMCDRVGILNGGRLVAEGTVSELRRLVPARQLAELESQDLSVVANRCRELGWQVRESAGRLTALMPERGEMGELVDRLRGLPLRSVALREVGLEDVWIEVTRAAANLGDSASRPPRGRPDAGKQAGEDEQSPPIGRARSRRATA